MSCSDHHSILNEMTREKHFLKFVLYNWTRIFPNNAIKEIISVIIEIYESAMLVKQQ